MWARCSAWHPFNGLTIAVHIYPDPWTLHLINLLTLAKAKPPPDLQHPHRRTMTPQPWEEGLRVSMEVWKVKGQREDYFNRRPFISLFSKAIFLKTIDKYRSAGCTNTLKGEKFNCVSELIDYGFTIETNSVRKIISERQCIIGAPYKFSV